MVYFIATRRRNQGFAPAVLVGPDV